MSGSGIERVRVEVEAGILRATLVDVENRNAMGDELVAALTAAIERAERDATIRAVVLTNEGSTFCAGANLKEQAKRNAAGESTAIAGYPPLLRKIQACPKPVIGRIDGHVVGGGMGIAAVCDIAVAREDATFGFSEVRLGVAPAMVAVVCIPKMRPGDVAETFLRGNRFPARQAADYGLIQRAVPGPELDGAVDEILSDLRQGGPNALGMAKRIAQDIPNRSIEDAFAWTSELSAKAFASDEAREGMQAFLEKRKPSWTEADDG